MTMINNLRRRIEGNREMADPDSVAYRGCRSKKSKYDAVRKAKAKLVKSEPIGQRQAKGKIYCGTIFGRISLEYVYPRLEDNLDGILEKIAKEERKLSRSGLTPQYLTFDSRQTYSWSNCREDYAYVVNFFKDNRGGN